MGRTVRPQSATSEGSKVPIEPTDSSSNEDAAVEVTNHVVGHASQDGGPEIRPASAADDDEIATKLSRGLRDRHADLKGHRADGYAENSAPVDVHRASVDVAFATRVNIHNHGA